MPDYSYNKDYPFAAFITNLGKYNEGELCLLYTSITRSCPTTTCGTGRCP